MDSLGFLIGYADTMISISNQLYFIVTITHPNIKYKIILIFSALKIDVIYAVFLNYKAINVIACKNLVFSGQMSSKILAYVYISYFKD